MRVRCPYHAECDAYWCRHRGEHDLDPRWCNDPCDYLDDEEDVTCEPVDEEAEP